MDLRKASDLDRFLQCYPRMTITPRRDSNLRLEGTFDFSAQAKESKQITDFYQLRIDISSAFPLVVPDVTEIGRKIPRDGKYHVNSDGTLCLGSPLRLKWKLSQKPTLIGFAANCLAPYLYAISHSLKYGGKFPFGELDHGRKGVVADYLALFSLRTEEEVRRTLFLLGMKKRIANKKPCPCGCGRRLGVCRFHYKINNFRKLAHRAWFRAHERDLGTKM